MKTVRQEITRDASKSSSPRIYFSIQDVDVPEPGRSQVLVQVKACSLSLVNQKILGQVLGDNVKGDYPCGQDVAGVVHSVGEGVTNVAVGDEVTGVLPLDAEYSGCGEFCLFHEYDLVKKPRMLSFSEAAAGVGESVRAYTALHYLARVCAGDTVLVIDAASAFGATTVQLAKLWGAKVIATVSSPEEKSYLESLIPSLGQIVEISHRSNLLVGAVMEETGGLGVDVVIDNGVKMYTNEEDSKLPSEWRKFPTPHKHDVISCLGIAGKWVTRQYDLQLDPPDSQQLFLHGASLGFLFDSAWMLSSAQQGRYQHILHDAVDKLDRGILKCRVNKTVSLESCPAELSVLSDLRTGKAVMST